MKQVPCRQEAPSHGRLLEFELAVLLSGQGSAIIQRVLRLGGLARFAFPSE
jgi:hypothetical protein